MSRSNNLTPNAAYWESLSKEERRKLTDKDNTYSVFDEDSDFWNDYNQLNDQYKKRLDPLLHYDYQLGFWDRLGNWLGFNTAEDRYRMDLQQKARLALQGLQDDVFQDNYNSESAKASRMRDAGLNPDLQGEVEGDPASGLEQPLQPIDPSVFAPPTELLTDLTSVFGSALTGCQNIGTFVQALGQLRKLKADTTNVQISNADEAFDYAGKWLSSFDPVTRLDFGDVDVTEDFFNQKAPAAIVKAFATDHPGLNKEAQAMVNRAMNARLRDPEMMYNYYTRYKNAATAKVEAIANKKAIGKPLEEAEDFVYAHNQMMIDYMSKAYKNKYAFDSMILDFNIQKCHNDFNYEAWKTKYNIPQEIAEADLEFYLKTQAEHKANKDRYEFQQRALNTVKQKMEKGDPFASYLYYSWLNPNGMIPLMSNSFNLGRSGVSWQTMPGFGSNVQPIQSVIQMGRDLLDTNSGGGSR